MLGRNYVRKPSLPRVDQDGKQAEVLKHLNRASRFNTVMLLSGIEGAEAYKT
jgi:hypothetical protein